jgi:hypothetical protein
LGWVNLPNVDLPDMYGPRIFLRTNAQRFRNDRGFTPRVPEGVTRIICSGDSFTLGYGVDNDHTWPALLAAHGESIETVNMGQGGYGVDQAYLWYKRDGAKLDHGIHVFAFIWADFDRAQTTEFLGYGKPILALEQGRLVTRNVPVPRSRRSRFLERARDAVGCMDTIQVVRRALRLDGAGVVPEAQAGRDRETLRVLPFMFDALADLNRAKGSVLVLAYLPIRAEYTADLPRPWRRFVADYAREHNILFLDFVDDLRRVCPTDVDRLFIDRSPAGFVEGAGHYSAEGNRFIADLMYRRLLEDPRARAMVRAKAEAGRSPSL